MPKQGPSRCEIKQMHGRTMKSSKTNHVVQSGNSMTHLAKPHKTLDHHKMILRSTAKNQETALAIQQGIKISTFKQLVASKWNGPSWLLSSVLWANNHRLFFQMTIYYFEPLYLVSLYLAAIMRASATRLCHRGYIQTRSWMISTSNWFYQKIRVKITSN